MSVNKTQSVPQGQFLTMAGNLLYKAILEPSRTKAKHLFRELEEGKRLALTNIQMEDKSTVRFDLMFDHSEYRGKLNFGAFRSSVAMLLSSLGEALKKEEEVPVFSAHQDPNMMIFGITGVTKESADPNVMVLGADTAADSANVLLRLMYIDPAQFELDPQSEV